MSAVAQVLNISQYTSEDKSYPFTVLDANGAVVDITGWTIAFAVTPCGSPTDLMLSKHTGSGIVLTNPTGGVFTVSLVAADVAAMAAGQLAYFSQRTDSGSDTVLFTGLFTLLPL